MVDLQAVSKSYSIYASPVDRLKELATFNLHQCHQDFWALRDVSFSAQKGQTFCIIGQNGSGKSTLLQLIAGICSPTEGICSVHGRVAALLELGTGFNPHFTGRENVYLNASILGFSKREIDAKFREIAYFAQIGRFIDQPIRTYSSGMIVRLAFAVAIHVDPQVLIVDEALAVGDISFRQRCIRKIQGLQARGVTIFFVSHSMADVRAVGDACLWLHRGRIRALGETCQVVDEYLAAMTAGDAANLQHSSNRDPLPEAAIRRPKPIRHMDSRKGDQRATITDLTILDEDRSEVHSLTPLSRVIVRIGLRANTELNAPCVGFVVRNHLGLEFAATDTSREDCPLGCLQAGEFLTVEFHLDLPEVYQSAFSFSPVVRDGNALCDWIDNAVTLEVSRTNGHVYGYLHLPCRMEINSRLSSDQPKLVVGQ